MKRTSGIERKSKNKNSRDDGVRSSQVEASKTRVKAGLPQFRRITAIIFRGSIRTCVYA